MTFSVQSRFLGSVSYDESLKIQYELADQVRQTSIGFVVGVEHPPVITLGKRSDTQLDLKSDSQSLQAEDIAVARVDRGGEAVLHSPGQLVIYPLLPIRDWKLGVRDYVGLLERSLIELLEEYGIPSHSGRLEPGVFTTRGKIAMIGIRVDRGVTRHGIALNNTNDLSLFRHIRCCGQENERMDRIRNWNINATQMELFEKWVQILRREMGKITDSTLLIEPGRISQTLQPAHFKPRA